VDKLIRYRQYVQDFLIEQSKSKIIGGDIETEIIFDEKRDRFLLVDLGWNQYQRIYNCVIHLEIREQKIWIQRNQTDQPIADAFISMGVNREDIVLGLKPPAVREYKVLGVV